MRRMATETAGAGWMDHKDQPTQPAMEASGERGAAGPVCQETQFRSHAPGQQPAPHFHGPEREASCPNAPLHGAREGSAPANAQNYRGTRIRIPVSADLASGVYYGFGSLQTENISISKHFLVIFLNLFTKVSGRN